MFGDPIYVTEKHAYRGAKAEDPLRYRAPRARDSGREPEGDSARVTSNCVCTIIWLVGVQPVRNGTKWSAQGLRSEIRRSRRDLTIRGLGTADHLEFFDVASNLFLARATKCGGKD